MTRYEAAALLSACLDRVTEVTDELKRLLKEFETELAILKGRVDGSKPRLANWKQPSSPLPPSSGKTVWVAGATKGVGDEDISDDYNAAAGAFSFSYDLRLGLKTSFTGRTCSTHGCVQATWEPMSLVEVAKPT